MLRLVKLAWRDIWRNRRRTLLTTGAVFFAVVVISLANSVQFGTYDAMEQSVVRLTTSELQVQHPRFHEERTLEHSLQEKALDIDELRLAHPWIVAASRRLTGFGLVSSDSASAGALIMGVDPVHEPTVAGLLRLDSEETTLTANRPQSVLLGAVMARNLGVIPGDSVVVLTQGYHNVMGAEVYAVQGLVRTGTPQMDRATMVTTLTAAQDLFSMPGRYSELVLRTDRHTTAREHAMRLESTLATEEAAVLPWQVLMPDLDQMRRLDDASNAIFYVFLLLLIGFEIFNTTAMSMMERVREFGVMMAMGLKPSLISGLVAMELAMKVLLGIGAGIVVTAGVVAILAGEPIALSQDMRELYDDFGFVVDGLYFTSRPSIYALPVVAVSIMSLLSMGFPILKMRSFSPVKALRAA